MLMPWPFLLLVLVIVASPAVAQDVGSEAGSDKNKVELGSRTAKAGFANEDAIRDKFNNWKSDSDSRAWLEAMQHVIADVSSVEAQTLDGKKADVQVVVHSTTGIQTEQISIKLVSSPIGFNQIDKRWLATYAEMWSMPQDVVQPLNLFVGETAPLASSRDSRRMFLDELDRDAQQAVVDFFTANKTRIVTDLFAGEGEHAAEWIMVTHKPTDDETDKPKWIIRSIEEAISFYSEGPVELTKAGNLKIGRITMQRKGGDNGRETASMLQFKMNPTLLFDIGDKAE